MNCQTCGEPLVGRQRMFCSIPCRNSANGKKTGGWNKNRVELSCAWCGEPFEVPVGRAETAKDCSMRCHNLRVTVDNVRLQRLSAEKNGMWRDGRSPIYYRQFLKDSCELCGATKKLVVHHRDHDRTNSNPENLATWCRKCHQDHHAEPRRDETGRYLPADRRLPA